MRLCEPNHARDHINRVHIVAVNDDDVIGFDLLKSGSNGGALPFALFNDDTCALFASDVDRVIGRAPVDDVRGCQSEGLAQLVRFSYLKRRGTALQL